MLLIFRVVVDIPEGLDATKGLYFSWWEIFVYIFNIRGGADDILNWMRRKRSGAVHGTSSPNRYSPLRVHAVQAERSDVDKASLIGES